MFYTTELGPSIGDGDSDEIEVAHIHTGDSTLDFIFKSLFPLIYRLFIVFIVIFSLLINIYVREKNPFIKTAISKAKN